MSNPQQHPLYNSTSVSFLSLFPTTRGAIQYRATNYDLDSIVHAIFFVDAENNHHAIDTQLRWYALSHTTIPIPPESLVIVWGTVSAMTRYDLAAMSHIIVPIEELLPLSHDNHKFIDGTNNNNDNNNNAQSSLSSTPSPHGHIVTDYLWVHYLTAHQYYSH